MKFVIRCTFAAAVIAAAAQHNLFAQEGAEAIIKAAAEASSSLDLVADKFEVDQKSGWTTATGNVHIRTHGHELKADSVRLHQERGDVEAKGNVLLKRDGLGAWSGDYIEYNYKTGKGMTGKGFIRAGEFFVSAEELTRATDGKTIAKKAIVSTCTNHVDHLHWCVTGEVIYKDNDYIKVKNAIPWLFGIPVGYMPF